MFLVLFGVLEIELSLWRVSDGFKRVKHGGGDKIKK